MLSRVVVWGFLGCRFYRRRERQWWWEISQLTLTQTPTCLFAALHAGLFLLLWVYKLAYMALLRLISPCGKHQCKMAVMERRSVFTVDVLDHGSSLSHIDVHMYVASDSGGRVDEDSRLFIFIPRFSGWRSTCKVLLTLVLCHKWIHIFWALWHRTWVGGSDDIWLTDIPELGS